MSDASRASVEMLRAHAQASKKRVATDVRAAMKLIEEEIEEAGGIYPFGKLTQRELCRRAGITQATLQKSTHKTTTLISVNAWLERIADGLRTSTSVRKRVNTNLEALKKRNSDLKQEYHECELRLIDANNEIARLKDQIAALSAVDGRVTSITAGRDRKANVERAPISEAARDEE